jgi:hypothetical protein
MSLQAEVSRSRHAQRSHQKQTNRKKRNKPRKQQPLVALPAVLNDNQCLTFREWCGLGRFSPRTGRDTAFPKKDRHHGGKRPRLESVAGARVSGGPKSASPRR